MKVKSPKFLIIFLLPFLLLAFSPMGMMICMQKMEDCSGCCPHASLENSILPGAAQISSQDVCCVFQSTQRLTAVSSFQKSDDFSKKKFSSLSFDLYPLSLDLQSLPKPQNYPVQVFALLPRPPLILVKSSFLI